MKILKKIKKGFTLVELVVVIAIIAILSGVSVGVYVGITNNAKQSASNQEANTIGTVVRAAVLMDAQGYKFNGLKIDDGNFVAPDYKAYKGFLHVCLKQANDALPSSWNEQEYAKVTITWKDNTVVASIDELGFEPEGELTKANYVINEVEAIEMIYRIVENKCEAKATPAFAPATPAKKRDFVTTLGTFTSDLKADNKLDSFKYNPGNGYDGEYKFAA